MKLLHTLSFLFLFICTGYAQGEKTSHPERYKNILYGQFHPLTYWSFGGPSGFLEIGYERMFGKRLGGSVRIGFHPNFNNFRFGSSTPGYLFPISFQKIFFPLSKHQLEIGIGVAPRLEPYNGKVLLWIFAPTYNLMYRWNVHERLTIRAGANAYFLAIWPLTFSPNVGLGVRL